MFVISRSTSRVPQATLLLSLSIPSLLSLLPGANAAPTPNPSAPTTSQVGELAQGSNHKPRSGLPGSALVAIVAVSLTVVILSATLLFMYVRRQRMRQKRAEHRKRAAQFQEMHRSGARPYNTGGSAPIAVSLSIPASGKLDEKKEMMGPRYPIKAYVV